MILYYRTLPKTVGAVRHKDQNAYRGLSILIRLQETLLSWYSRAFFYLSIHCNGGISKSIRRCTIYGKSRTETTNRRRNRKQH